MARIERKYMAHFIDCATPESGEELYERLGNSLEEYTPELSAQVDKKRNILGETDIIISGYEKTAEVATYYADPDTELYNRLQEIVDRGLTMDSLHCHVVDVKLWNPLQEDGYPAVRHGAYIEVKSYGGDASGYQIPFTLHYTGKQDKGYFDVENRFFCAAEEE